MIRILLLSIFLVAVLAQNVAVYQDINYGGSTTNLAVGSDYASMPSGWNDKISSLIVPTVAANYWTYINLYEDINYATSYRTFGTGAFSLGIPDMRDYSFNDKASSAKVRSTLLTSTPVLTVYEDANYGGISQGFYPGSNFNLTAIGWGNRISSLVVAQGGLVTLWNSVKCTGSSIQYAALTGPSNVPTMPIGWNDAVLSFSFLAG
jgi:hypothetical protein